MIARTKIFLLWLLALTIPVQGLAAVTQLACAPGHQMQMATNMHMAHTDAAMHLMHAMPMAHMEHMAHSTGQHDQHSPQDQQHHQASASSCSSCTVCTIGAILPLALDQLLHLPFPADIHIALIEQGFVGYTPENPERPPSLPA
jgi:uncharacterized protein involved in copper resistance